MKREELIKSVLDDISSKCTQRSSPSNAAVSFKGTVSLKIYNSMKPVKFGLKMFVVSDSMNKLDPDLLNAIEAVKESCVLLS